MDKVLRGVNKSDLHTGEEYSPEVKPTMDKAEGLYTDMAQKMLDRVNAKILNYARAKLTVAKANETIDKSLTNDDFKLDLRGLLPAMVFMLKYQRDLIGQKLIKKGLSPKAVDALLEIRFDIDPNDVRFISLLKKRQNYLAEVLRATTVKKADKIIEYGIKNGKTFDEIANKLSDSLGFDKKRALTIARTEANWSINEGVRQHMQDLGITQFQISPASNACELCMEASKRIYNVGEEDILPIHPRCRCILISIIPKEWLQAVKSLQQKIDLKKSYEEATNIEQADLNGVFDIKIFRGKDGTNGLDGSNGLDGEDGKTPVKGVDYFTDTEVKGIIKKSTPKLGRDYMTPKEIESIKKSVTPKKGKDYMTKADAASIIDSVLPILKKSIPKESKLIKSIEKSTLSKNEINDLIFEGMKKLKIAVPKPMWGQIIGALADQTDLVAYIAAQISPVAVQSDWDELDNTKLDFIKNKPTIPTQTSQLTNDSGFISSTSTNTLTNKRITSRVQSVADAATITPSATSDDCVDITAIAQAFTIANPTGSPTNFQKLIIRIKDDGTARAFTFGTGYVAGGIALPTTTVISKILTLGFIYNTANSLNKWQLVALAREA